jgi:hypothetical protein
LLLALGEVVEAGRWASERGPRGEDVLSLPGERDDLVLARMLLAGGAPDRAAALLDRLHAAAAPAGGGRPRLRSASPGRRAG